LRSNNISISTSFVILPR